MAANLYVSLLEDVEQADLDPLGQVRQFVDGEDAAVDPGHQAEVNGQLVAQVASLGDLDRVDLPDEVGDGDVGRRELFRVPVLARQPLDRRAVAALGEDRAAFGGDRAERVFGDFRPVDHRRFVVEQRGQATYDARLRLAPFAEEDDVLAAENGVGNLRDDGVFVAHDAREQRFATLELADQVAAHFRLDRQDLVAGVLEFAQGGGCSTHQNLRTSVLIVPSGDLSHPSSSSVAAKPGPRKRTPCSWAILIPG